MIEYEIEKIGTLKFSRIESISKLRKSLTDYGIVYTIIESKEIIDKLLDNKFKERFDFKYKNSFDLIFNDIEYVYHDDEPIERNFPINFIPPG